MVAKVTKPKTHLTPYLCFSKERMPGRPAGVLVKDYAKVLGAEWKLMSDSEKAKYANKCAVGAKKEKVLKTKTHLTPYMCFSKERMPGRPAGVLVKDYAKVLGDEWKSMSASEKAKYAAKCAVGAKKVYKNLTLKQYILKELRAKGLSEIVALKRYKALTAEKKKKYADAHKLELKKVRKEKAAKALAKAKAAGTAKSYYKPKTIAADAGSLNTYLCFAKRYRALHPQVSGLTGEAAKAAKKAYMVELGAAWAAVKGTAGEHDYKNCKAKSKKTASKKTASKKTAKATKAAKKTKKVKKEGAAKKPLNAYIQYTMAHRASMKKAHPDASPKQIMSLLAAKYNAQKKK